VQSVSNCPFAAEKRTLMSRNADGI